MSNKKGTFQPGGDTRRNLGGRPTGSPNRNKLDISMDSLLKLTPKAVKKLEAILNEEIKGTTPAQVLQAALKILELASKYETEKELKDAPLDEGKPKEELPKAPRISITATK